MQCPEDLAVRVCLQFCLIPGEFERGELGINTTGGSEEASLDGEQFKRETGFIASSADCQIVRKRALCDDYVGGVCG
jgi:hypothetical protein